MKHTHIVLKDNDLYAIVAPNEKAIYNDSLTMAGSYLYALQQAITNGVKFNPEHDYPILPQMYGVLEQLMPYPVPEGYEVRIETDDGYAEAKQYAIIVNKHKMRYLVVFVMGDKPPFSVYSGTLFGVNSFETIDEANTYISKCMPSENGSYIIVPYYEPDKV